MAGNCDENYQKIQRLLQLQRAINDELNKIPGVDQKLLDGFYSGKDRLTGEPLQVNFDAMFREMQRMESPAMQDWAARAVGHQITPVGAEGQFQNVRQLVDRLGVDNAEQMAALVDTLTGSWEKHNPDDFMRAIAVNDRDVFAQRLADGYGQLGLALDQDKLVQAITANAAPFTRILDQQTRLQVFHDATKANVLSKLALLTNEIRTTGREPSALVKQEFVDAYRKAVYANRAAAYSRRVSGQLLQQLQNDPGMDISGLRARNATELQRIAEEVYGDMASLVSGDGLLGKVMEASNRGVDGVKDLEGLVDTVQEELPDPTSQPIDAEFTHDWRRNAKAYYKDSQLFNLNTQIINNYLSGKMIFVAEGYRKAFENGVILRAQDTRKPIGTRWHRDLLDTDKTFLGARVAAEAGIMAHDVIRQSWKDSVKLHFMEAQTPFAGNPDTLGASGTVSIPEQYDMALKVLFGENVDEAGDPVKRMMYEEDDGTIAMTGANDPSIGNFFGGFDAASGGGWPIQLRDKSFVGLKLLMNHLIEKQTGVRLPVASALQMMGAVDNRAGLRVYMTMRANQLMLDRIQLRPDESWPERRAWVRKQLDDALYEATPTAQNIRDGRQQFGLEDASDEEVAVYLAANKVGMPVILSDAQREAFEFAGYTRLQNEPKGPISQRIDKMAMGIREDPYLDGLFPYWRSPFNQTLWNMRQAFPDIALTAKWIFGGRKWAEGRGVKMAEPTAEEVAKVAGSWATFASMLALFHAVDAAGWIEGTGPMDPQARSQWKRAGHVPNSLFGMPIPGVSGLPILSTLLLYKDLKETFLTGEYSDYDKANAMTGLMQVGVGYLMRQTSLGQLSQLMEALTSDNPRAFQRLMGYLINGQVNPASGVIRQVEGLIGQRGPDLYSPRMETQQDKDLRAMIGDDDPLKRIEESLRSWVYSMTPSLSGYPTKETDYLGYKLRLPEGIFRNEWQQKAGVGVPGLWPSWLEKGRTVRSPVHAWLDRFGGLVPPKPLIDGRLDGVLMGVDLEKEYNHYVGTVKGGAISDDPVFGNRLWWGKTSKDATTDNTGLREVEPTVHSVDLNANGFMDRLTRGKTLDQALRALLVSETNGKLERDPQTTTDRSITDRPLSEVRRQPGPVMARLLHDYYGALAARQVQISTTPAAAEWRKLRDAAFSQQIESKIEPQVQRVESMIGR